MNAISKMKESKRIGRYNQDIRGQPVKKMFWKLRCVEKQGKELTNIEVFTMVSKRESKREIKSAVRRQKTEGIKRGLKADQSHH